MSGGRRPPFEDGRKNQTEDFRVPSSAAASSNWLRTTAAYQIDNSNGIAGGSSTTTTTRHFAAWEQTTTHFNPRGQHTHPLLAASVSLNSPVIRPIPNRLASPPEAHTGLLGLGSSPSVPSIKLETRPLEGSDANNDDAGNDSAFEDWPAAADQQSCSRTTPVNHKSIRKWRQQSQPGGGSRHSSLATPPSSFQPISIMTSTPIEASLNLSASAGGPISAPSVIQSWQHQQHPNRPGSAGYSSNDSLFTSPASCTGSITDSSSITKKRLKSETVTSPDSVSSVESSSLSQLEPRPVGIAVARQRSTATSSSMSMHSASASEHAAANISEVTGGGRLHKNSLDDSGIDMKRPAPPLPPPPPLQSRPASSTSDSFLESWLRQPHLWPVSYPTSPLATGYQFVKDPLTGQMFFVPGFSAAPLWPASAAAAAAAAAAASPTAASFGLTPFQQSLMRLQQESLLVRQAGFLFNQQQRPQSPPAPSPQTRPTAPPPPDLEPPEIKVNGAAVGSAAEDNDDHLSVGDARDELKQPLEEQPDVKVKLEDDNEKEENNGLHLLTEGIARLENKADCSPQRPSRLGLLCDAAFLSDDEHHLKSSRNDCLQEAVVKARSRSLDSQSIKNKTKHRPLSSDYRSPKAERNAKAFIASKSLKVSEELSSSSDLSHQQPKNSSLSTMQPRVKMNEWEQKMRLDLADIQKKYKEKYKELYKLQHKTTSAKKATAPSSPTKGQQSKPVETKKTLAPISPWLTTFKLKINGQHGSSQKKESITAEAAGTEVKVSEHPAETAASAASQKNNGHTGPDLSTITSKFRSARPNPFENLLKLSCVGKKTQEGVKKTEDDLGTETAEVTDDHKSDFLTSTPKMVFNKPAVAPTQPQKKEAFLLSDDLKPLPKLHLASNNNVKVEAEDSTAGTDADVSDEDDTEDSPPVLEPMIHAKNNGITVKIKRQATSPSPPSRPKKSKKEKKAKKAKKDRHHDHHPRHHGHHKKHHKKPVVHVNDDSTNCIDLTNMPQPQPQPTGSNLHAMVAPPPKPPLQDEDIAKKDVQGPESCVIKETDLVGGLRVLVKLDGHFHPGKIQAISPPDIYGVLVDKERGNKPHIFSREEVLREAIFEVKPKGMKSLPVGTRVCAYWSQKYNHLYPGAISDMDIDPKLDSNYVNIELDDGDNRDIHVDSIRFLPPDYPLVVYDPDPLMSTLSRRKRRQSWESGTSDGSRAAKTPRASIDEMSPPTPKNNHVHSGDLKMRIHVGAASASAAAAASTTNSNKQRKSSGNNPGQSSGGSNISYATSKNVRKASLAQRPSISSSSDSEDGKGGIASFLPKDQVWKWADKGQKRSKGRVYHRLIERKDEKLSIGDSAVFLSTNCPDQPYIGRLESMWETASGTKNVGVRWYYHLAEIDCSSSNDRQKLERIKRPKGALFESNHYDENDVQTISHRCDVLAFKSFLEADNDNEDNESQDKYYLAGNHNAIEKTVQLAPGVLKCD